MTALTSAQRAKLEAALRALDAARAALRDAGDCVPGETGRACHSAAQECVDSLNSVDWALRDDTETLAEYLASNPCLPLFLPMGATG